MNTPNKLTLLRVIMVPIFIWAITSRFYIAAIVIFALASLTDQLDGHLARKNNQVTSFGKLADPLADKLLSCLNANTDIPYHPLKGYYISACDV